LESKAPPTTEDGYAAPRLRLVLMVGFGAIAVIFLLVTIDAVRLLGSMRAENKILRDQALARTNHLASIRSSILLTHAYLGDYFLDSDREKSKNYLTKVQETHLRMRSDLADYRAITSDEEVLVKRLGDMLEQDWQNINRTMTLAVAGRPASKPLSDAIPTSKISVVEITTQLENLDTTQEATTEAQIRSQFEDLGGRLRTVLSLALTAALVLAIGCLVYISRIERQNRRRYEEILKGRKELEQLSARLVEAQETERRAISRELHDQVGQTLNALLVDAANLAKRIQPDDAASRRYLDNIRTFADSSVNSIRDIALLLRPSMLDDLGLIPALEWQAREVSRRTGIKVDVTAENVPDSLPDGVRTCVYRVVQEALQNVSRHSGAKTAVITVREEGGALFLSVADNGHGFDPKRTRGLGMLGMEERIRQLGGNFEVQSAPEKGATLRVTLPIEAAVSSH
jgi:signal transduction histidine kinase